MHRYLLPAILAVVTHATLLAAQDQRRSVTTSSDTWRVTVSGAEIYDKTRTGDEPEQWRLCNLRVDMHLQYLGESGQVTAPQVQVANDKGQKSRYVSVSVGFGSTPELLPWLYSGKTRAQHISLTKGQTVGGEKPLSYCFLVLPRRSSVDLSKRDFGELTLMVADTPPLILQPMITR